MKFPAKQSTDFKMVPAGNHVGICNAVVDLGLQRGSAMYPNPKHQVYLRFELPGERVTYTKDDKQVGGPMSVGTTMTASMGEKANLRRFIEGWLGKKFPSNEAAGDFDIKNLLGKRCLLNITHTEKGEKTYANIAQATPLPKGMVSTEPQHNPSLYFSLVEPDPAAYNALPQWLKDKIDNRLVKKEEAAEAANGHDTDRPPFDDDIPFAWAISAPVGLALAMAASHVQALVV